MNKRIAKKIVKASKCPKDKLISGGHTFYITNVRCRKCPTYRPYLPYSDNMIYKARKIAKENGSGYYTAHGYIYHDPWVCNVDDNAPELVMLDTTASTENEFRKKLDDEIHNTILKFNVR